MRKVTDFNLKMSYFCLGIGCTLLGYILAGNTKPVFVLMSAISIAGSFAWHKNYMDSI